MLRKTIYLSITITLAIVLILMGNGWQKVQALMQEQSPAFYVALDGDDANDGSLEHPWATVNHAAEALKEGNTVYIRAGTYALTQQIRAKHSGTADRWITYRSFPGEQVVLDAIAIPVPAPSGQPPFPHDQGTFQLENVEYVQVQGLEIINSHNSGITVRNSAHIKLYNNKTENTFSPGIGVWHSHDQRIVGNTVTNANAREMADFISEIPEAPHESISLGSVEDFEVAYNLVHHGQKEGIDIKGASKHGTVHHNYVHHMAWQALYVDSWRGVLEDIELMNNVAHDCGGAGFAISVEGTTGADGIVAKNIRFHHNLLYDNWGTGIFFSRWGGDGLRENIKIDSNTVYHNGHGQPKPDEDFYWMTGGLYLFSDNLQDIEITNNIFSENAGFQIGYSDRYLTNTSHIEPVFERKNIEISHNLVSGPNNANQSIYAGWPPDNYANIRAIDGTEVITSNPEFIDPEAGNFYLHQPPTMSQTASDSNAGYSETSIGAFPTTEQPDLWWQVNFPPNLIE